jgi:hypothetical protein
VVHPPAQQDFVVKPKTQFAGTAKIGIYLHASVAKENTLSEPFGGLRTDETRTRLRRLGALE